MRELLVNNGVLLLVAFMSLWWAGGRDRRALAGIRERVELLALLGSEHPDLSRRLRREVEARSTRYAERPATWPLYLSTALVLAGAVVGGVLKHAYPDSETTWFNAIAAGAASGSFIGFSVTVLVSWMSERRERRRRKDHH